VLIDSLTWHGKIYGDPRVRKIKNAIPEEHRDVCRKGARC
jgi:hypothetical protein